MKQLIVFTVAFLIVCGNLIAQPPDTLWSRIHSISPMGDIDDGKCVRQTTDGGYIITGSCVPNGLESHVDLLLLKTDTLGHILWTQTYGRGFVEEGLSVEQTSDGGYIIGGRAVSGVYPVVDPPYSDVWMLKTDSYGDTLWTKTYGDSGTNEYCTSIQQTPDLGYIMTGTMNSEYCYPNYEINEEYDPVASRAWLLRTDSSGDTLWTKFYLERSYGNSVVQTSDGGFVIAGWVFPDEQDIQSDVLLIKTDSSGDTLWTKTIEGADYEVGFCARQTYDGYVLVGQTKPAGSRYNALLIKTDLSGEVLWTRNIGGDLSDAGFTVEVASDGGFFITGTTNGNWWVHQGDMWAFKTDANGSLLWEVIYDLALCDFAWCGIQTSDNGYVLTGMTSSGFGGNLWLAKLSHPSGVRNRPSAVTDFALHQNYPNPFNASTTISYDIPKPCWVNISIYNTTGQRIATLIDDNQLPGHHSEIFNADILPSGIYFYRIRAGSFTNTQKMVLLK